MFEFHAVIPDVKDLTVQVIDNDYGNDEIIGETQVDLENRLLTRRHAIAGLPSTYHMWVIKQHRLFYAYVAHCRFNSIQFLPSKMYILYFRSGPDKWRLGTHYTPSVILKKFCEDRGIEHCFSNSDNSILRLKSGRNERHFTIQDFGN